TIPSRGILLVEGIGSLKPRAGESKIDVDRVRLGNLKIDAVKYVFLIALRVYDRKFGRIQETSTVQPVYRDEVAPVLASVSEIESRVGCPEASIGSRYRSVRSGKALARACCGVDDNARLLAVLSRWRAGDDFERLNCIEWNLIREYFALLIGDRLPVQRKGILRMVTKTVKEAIGIGSNSRTAERNQGTQ